jgi:hypothetical protein
MWKNGGRGGGGGGVIWIEPWRIGVAACATTLVESDEKQFLNWMDACMLARVVATCVYISVL